MLVVMKPGANESDLRRVLAEIEKVGMEAQILPRREPQTTVYVPSKTAALDEILLSNLSQFSVVKRITKSHQLTSLEYKPEKTVVRVGAKARVGNDELTIIAGVCAVESREQVFAVAEAVKKSGAHVFRGGAFKPRTSPYAFQGLGEAGLEILAEARERFGLAIVTEAMDDEQLALVEQYADCIQIGARNMQNFSLLRRAGKSNLPVLLKRGMSATLDDLLSAAEYILAEGNPNVILCERGIRTFSNHARNTLDLSIVPAIQKISHLPVIVDPSHGTGKNFMVAPLARAAVAVGADGVLIEIHPEPAKALSDGAQALTPAEYLEMTAQLKVLREVLQPAFADA
jgi:3-deoxy-7-phosphoheptulonate synthase